MALNLMHFVQQLFQHPHAGQAAMQAHPQVQRPQLQYLQPKQPLPDPATHQVDPHQQALYNQVLAHYQALAHPLHVMASAHAANLGIPYMYNGPGLTVGQGSEYNPGLVPFQDGGNPQIGAFQDQPGQLNPRQLQYRIQPGQEWLP